MPGRGSRFVLLGVLFAALFAAGCGGDSDEDKTKDYRETLSAAATDFNRELAEAGTIMRAAGQAKSAERYGQGAEQLQAAVDDFKKELEELDTPSDAENEQEAVTEAVDDFADSVGRINAAVQAEDDEGVQAEAAAVQAKGAEVDQAIKTLKEAVE